MLRLTRTLRIFAVGLVLISARGFAAAPTEAQVKAVFLYHFTQFVVWPEAAFANPDAPFVIGLVGADPMGGALEGVVGGESVGRHHLTVQNVTDVSAEFRCQILYFTQDGEDLLDLRRLRTAPVLTVGESESFYKKGGMIQFFIDRRRVRLKVNLEEARAHSLEISAKLLRIADVTEWDPIRIGIYTMEGDLPAPENGRLVNDPVRYPQVPETNPDLQMRLAREDPAP